MHRGLSRRIVELHGERGEAWLVALPSLIATCEERWSIAAAAPFAKLSYHWVAPASGSDGASLVLKLGVPNPELSSEIAALSAWAGRGAVRIVAADPALGALLIERLRPGTSLAELGLERDGDATAIAARLMQELHALRVLPEGRTLSDWTRGIARARAAGFAASIVERAAELRDELLATATESVLLHADLHHDNILAAERRPWLCVDPKGVVGDPAYEPAPFLLNPWAVLSAAPDAAAILARRIDCLAEIFERRRVVGWAFVHAVLSAWWTFEDHGAGHEPALRLAELIQTIR